MARETDKDITPKKIRRILKVYGLKKSELAKLLDSHASAVTYWTQNKRKPSRNTIAVLRGLYNAAIVLSRPGRESELERARVFVRKGVACMVTDGVVLGASFL